jgi:hypothetical protein
MPLTEVIRQEIALPLQHLSVYTVGGLLSAWRNPKNQRCIEQLFESPQQARHAVAVCAAFVGIPTQAVAGSVPHWWSVN